MAKRRHKEQAKEELKVEQPVSEAPEVRTKEHDINPTESFQSLPSEHAVKETQQELEIDHPPEEKTLSQNQSLAEEVNFTQSQNLVCKVSNADCNSNEVPSMAEPLPRRQAETPVKDKSEGRSSLSSGRDSPIDTSKLLQNMSSNYQKPQPKLVNNLNLHN